MKKYILIALLGQLMLVSCFKWDNPVDPDVAVCGIPFTITATPFQVTLQWQVPSQIPSGYLINKKTSNGAWVTNYANLIDGTISSFTDTNVAPSTSYQYRLKCFYDQNQSQEIVNSITSLAFNPPTNLVFTLLSLTSLRLDWTDNTSYEQGYKIDRKVGTGNWQTDYATVADDVHTWTDNQIAVNTTYTYRVKGYYQTNQTIPLEGVAPMTGQTVATPTFNPSGGTYNTAQDITITSATPGAVIRYSINGGDPTESSTLYTTPVHITAPTTTIKARAFQTGWNYSAAVSAIYDFKVSTPTFNPAGGTYISSQYVTLSCATSGATIRYTTNGNDPTESSAQYTGAITVSATATTTLKAKAFKSGWTPSSVANASYTMLINFIYVPGGTFNNGTSDVTVSSFYMSKYELTQAEYQAVMGSNPASGCGVGSDYPVYYVSWFNAIEYCNRRSINEGRTPCYSYSTYGTNPTSWPAGWNTSSSNHTNVSCNWTANGYRLPTEAEWEFAARGGNQTHGYTYSGSSDIHAVGWYWDNSGSTTHTVGTKTANELGIYDMSGNVWEWVWDIYGSYPSGAQTNPHGAAGGYSRVLRGGSWFDGANYCTVSLRNYYGATNSDFFIGFRCVRVSP